MNHQLELGNILVDVVKKDIKHLHLSVHPPHGHVRISAPKRMSLDTIRLFAITKIQWIRHQQEKYLRQERETPRDCLTRESHNVWGTRYLLKVMEHDGAPRIELTHCKLVMHIRPDANAAKRNAILEAWYRAILRKAAEPIIEKWEHIIGVRVKRIFVQKMKTRWGACNPIAQSIRLNTELAKKPIDCLEYIVVHEMVHLLERHHGMRFQALMDRYYPSWRVKRELLNRLPLG